MAIPSARRSALVLGILAFAFAGCDQSPTTAVQSPVKPSHDVVTQVFTSSANTDTWNAIVPASPQVSAWQATYCVTTPAVGIDDPRWTNPHKAFVSNGAAFQQWAVPNFAADWVNSWPTFEWYNLTAQYGGPPGDKQQSWTKYSAPVSGTGNFVLYLAADNCSWIYLADENGNNAQLVGVQLAAPWQTNITYPVTLSGNHKLIFLVFDGGGQSGGEFRLETNTSVVFTDTDGDGLANVSETNIYHTDPNNPDTDGDGISDGAEVAAGTDPLVANVVDSDHDGLLDNVDNCPAVANADQADLDGDGMGDACDPDIDGDGVANAADAFPTNPAEWADTDGDGVGDNADAFDNSNTGPTIVVVACQTTAPNWHQGGGTWANDLIASAYSSAANHGKFVSAVSDLADGWKKAGKITGRQQGEIVSCAARTK